MYTWVIVHVRLLVSFSATTLFKKKQAANELALWFLHFYKFIKKTVLLLQKENNIKVGPKIISLFVANRKSFCCKIILYFCYKSLLIID